MKSVKAHAMKEMAVLKKGGASPQLMAEEKAEYAKKGVKLANGGAVKARQTTKMHGKAC